jgi:hypothetical protein
VTAGDFELAMIGGLWGRRLPPRRGWIDDLPWGEELPRHEDGARVVWTRTAFSEYASAAAFAEIAAAMLACGAPIDLVAAAGDFVVDEIVHTEAAARVAGAAIRAFAPLVGVGCEGGTSGLGALGCDRYDPALAEAAVRRVARPLAERAIVVPRDDLAAVGAEIISDSPDAALEGEPVSSTAATPR